jgi:Tol biopolymer transport system component
MNTGKIATALLGIAMANLAASDIDSPETPYTRSEGSIGCMIEQITEGPFGQYQFQGVSKDGLWLSYNISETDEGPYHSVLMNLVDGTIEKQGPDFNNTGNFSQDNSTLVAAVFLADSTTDIVELDLQTGKTTTLAADPAYDWLPSYSPNQKTIAFNSFRTGNGDLYLYDRQTAELSRLTENPQYEAHAEFSPDGSKIMFHRMIGKREDGRYDFDIFYLDLEAGAEKRLTETPFEESYGSWSPDGNHFVYSTDFEENPEMHNLYIRSIEGDGQQQLTDGDWKDSYAWWTRDGKYIYFNSDRSGTTQVYRMSMAGMNCEKVI